MVLRNNLTYIPKIEEIEREEQVIELIKDVAVDIHLIGFPAADYNSKSILEVIEQGTYRAPKQRDSDFYNSVNLSKAQSLIQDYRRKSERGCQSCEYSDYNKHSMDEGTEYCNLKETKKDIQQYKDKDVDTSPTIKKYSEKGCGDRKPIFSKTIEELLN